MTRSRPLPRTLAAAASVAIATLPLFGLASAASAREPNFSSYQELLNRFLTRSSAPGESLETRFDYEELFITKGRDELLMRVRTDLLSVPAAEMSPKARIAWAINTYNFLVLETATQNLYERRVTRGKLEGRRALVRRGRGSVREIPDFFTMTVVTIGERSYSLNDFETHFLWADFPRGGNGTPPKSLDPRIHFAIVGGAKGGPSLQPRAYTADSLEIQLEAVTRQSLASPRHLKFVPDLNRVESSQIFTWYGSDFGGPEDAWEFARKYAPADMKKLMGQRKVADGSIAWDWKMNQTSMEGREQPVIRGNVSP